MTPSSDRDDVARHQHRGFDRPPLAVAHDRRFRGQPFSQRGQGAGCLAVLPEFECGIEEQQPGDDGEIAPVPDDGGDDRRRLDHVGDRTGEVPDELAGEALFFFDEGVRPVFGKAPFGLGAAQPLAGLDLELGQHPVDRRLLEVDGIVRSGLGRQGRGLQGRSGHMGYSLEPRGASKARIGIGFSSHR